MIKYVILNLEPTSNDKIQCSLQIKYLSTHPLLRLFFVQRLYNLFLGKTCKHDLGDHSDLNNKYKEWKKIYNRDESSNSGRDSWRKELNSALENLDKKLDEWLRDISFRAKIEKNFVSKLEKFITGDNCSVVFVIQSEDEFIYQLFWHNWELMKDPNYQKIPLVFAIKNQRKISQAAYVQLPNKSLEVLVISGDTRNLDPKQDTAAWQKFTSICNALKLDLRLYPSTETTGTDLTHWLDPESQHKFDIIYLLGHGSDDNSEQRIRISDTEFLTFKQFCYRVSKIKTLKLVILNYCNSLPLAKELIKSSDIPQVIAMRETIFDSFSPEFLTNFLLKLVRCNFLPLAVKEAQEHLEIEYSNEWRSSASVVALLQNLNKTPWTWPNNKESRFKNTILIGGLGFLFGFVIGLIYMPIISPLAKSIFMNIPIIRRLFPPLATDVKNLLAESTVTIKTYDPISKATSYFYGVIVAADKDIKKFSKDNKIYHVLTQAKLLEKGNKDNVYTIFTEQGPENSSQSYPPSNIKEISQDLAIVSFESNKEYKIAQLSATKAELDKTIIIGFRESPEATKQFNYFHSTIADTEPSPNNKIYTFFYNSIGNTQKIQTEANSIFDKHGCFIGIDLGKLNPYNRGIGISGEAILDLRKIQRLTSNIKSGTESTESVKKPYENLYTESCQYE
ncbi:MAG: hypothetical protein IM500_11935 [Microcystis sp. M179S2]|uniref:hypothetical protein n=1 Tax=Microcystis sp. M179S2 TaxID=2771160 RepID=UPI002583CDE9|nr:hypothetical protein [Microcystis sp. M179S2]MCA2701108.1 hypothetical protein [Microcystis sp. M179S2]